MSKENSNLKGPSGPPGSKDGEAHLTDAELVLRELASVFLNNAGLSHPSAEMVHGVPPRTIEEESLPKREDAYRVLVEQIPAVVFIAYLDQGISEAYVSPQIESALGFTQQEWLGDPIRWYGQIHPDDKERWSAEAAEMFLTGKPLKSTYRVFSRDGRVVWFQCEIKMVRKEDGRPWFLHGVGFDITELKQTEEALRERTLAFQNLSSRLLRTQDAERRRIARELHDSLGQYLAALKMTVGLLGSSQTGETKALCSEIEQIANRCIDETRTLSHLLHPPLLDELGFAEAARWYAEGFAKRSGIQVSLYLPPDLKRLPQAVEGALFRILQEALTNIHRHSGSQRAEIHLTIDKAEVSLVVQDHGNGIPTELLKRFHSTGGGTGVGLSGMRERVNELAGRLEIRSDNKGTILQATLPAAGAGRD